MLQATITEFRDEFKMLNGTIADINIKHILYGKQKIKKCVLHPFVDGDRIGLIINEEEIYITMEELTSVSINNAQCIIKSEVMELSINLL